MSAYAVPPAVLAALDQQLMHRERGALIDAARRLSEVYRAGGGSDIAIDDATAALAYAAVRMPATYAALTWVLADLKLRAPGFAPCHVIDIGAGTGAATLAAAEQFATLATAELIEPNVAMQHLAGPLLATTDLKTQFAVQYTDSGVPRSANKTGAGTLAIAGYVLAELPIAAVAAFLAPYLAQVEMLVIVEPGTPQGFQRILAVRRMVLEGDLGRIVAPCTHAGSCPLVGADWCHFSVRLPRSRLHQAIKAVDAPFEDERFSYLVVTRNAELRADGGLARVLAQPKSNKAGVELVLCSAAGRTVMMVPQRDKPRARLAKRLHWGDVAPGAIGG